MKTATAMTIISIFCAVACACGSIQTRSGTYSTTRQMDELSANPSWVRGEVVADRQDDDSDDEEIPTEPMAPVDNFELTVNADGESGSFAVALDGWFFETLTEGEKFSSFLEPGEHLLFWAPEEFTPTGPDYVWHLDVVDCRVYQDGISVATLEVDVDQADGLITFTMPEEDVSCHLDVVQEHFPNLRRVWVSADEPGAMPNAEMLAESACQMVEICPERAVLCIPSASGGQERWDEGDSELATRRMQACMDAVYTCGGTPYEMPGAPLWGLGDERGRGVAMECYESGGGSTTSQIVQVNVCTSDDQCEPGTCNTDSGLCVGPSAQDGQDGADGEGGIWDVLTFHVIPSLITRDDLFGARLGGALEFDLEDYILELGGAYGYLSGTGEAGDSFFDNTMLSVYLTALYEVVPWFGIGARLDFEENRGLLSQEGSESHDYRVGPAVSFHPGEDWTFELFPQYVRTLDEDEGYQNGFNLGMYLGYQVSDSFEIGFGYNWETH